MDLCVALMTVVIKEVSPPLTVVLIVLQYCSIVVVLRQLIENTYCIVYSM